MNKKTRDKLRKNPLGWTPNLHTAALDYIDQLEGQAPPILTEESRPVIPAILDQYTGPVRELLEERRRVGVARYGIELHTHNGRDAIQDARDELGDLIVYLEQARMEGRKREADDLCQLIIEIFA
jgi:hypothetical protein